MVQHKDEQFTLVLNRLENLLNKDLENQRGSSEVQVKLDLLKKDPEEWLKNNFNPMTFATETTLDWNKWVTYQD